jgi:hypothetical protein
LLRRLAKKDPRSERPQRRNPRQSGKDGGEENGSAKNQKDTAHRKIQKGADDTEETPAALKLRPKDA